MKKRIPTTWREVQQSLKVPSKWDIDLARSFNEWISDRDGHAVKPIVFDFKTNTRRVLGEHARDRIRVLGGRPVQELWRTLLHEIAHYRYPGDKRRERLEERNKEIVAWNAWHFGPHKEVGPEPPKPRSKGGIHDRPFVVELLRVYDLWREFLNNKEAGEASTVIHLPRREAVGIIEPATCTTTR